MRSKTVEKIVEDHAANQLVLAPTVAQLPADGRDLATDQPGGPLGDAVIGSAFEAMEGGQTHYVDVPGILPLREAVVADLAARGLPGYEATAAVVTASVQEARFLTLQIVGDAFGGVALPSVVHPGARKALGMRPLAIRWLEAPEDRGFLPTVQAIEGALTAGSRLIYLESPSRLTGASYSESEVAAIGGLAEAHDATLLWDQGLAGWTSDDAALAALAGHADRVTLLGDLFPGAGLEGLALGFVATNADHVAGLTAMKQIVSICTATASQYAALKVAEGYAERRGQVRETLVTRRGELLERLQALGAEVLPGRAASHVAVRASEALGSALHAGGVAAADGAGFGAPGVLRLAVPIDGAALAALEGGRA
jgi:arginine:pyruvate transaminase